MRSLILQVEEEVVTVFRASPAVLAFPGVLAGLCIFLPLWYVAHYELFAALGFWLGVWIVLVVVGFLRKVFLWRRETYTITTKRLVKTVHENLFRQVVSETALDRILNISFRTTGPWSILARFGDIDIQVVGRLEPIVVHAVHGPEVVKEFLWRLHERSGANTGLGHANILPNQPFVSSKQHE